MRGVFAPVRIALLIGATAAAVSACGSGATAAEPSAPTPTSVNGHQIGAPYPIRLLTHCGIEWAKFAGQRWKATSPRPEPATVPDPTTGLGSYDGYTEGTMTLLAPDRVRFDVTAPRSLPGGVEFTPTDELAPLCQ